MKTVLNDLESHNLTLTEAVTMAQNRPRWRLQAVSGAVLLVVVCARNEDDDDDHHHHHYHRHCSPVRVQISEIRFGFRYKISTESKLSKNLTSVQMVF